MPQIETPLERFQGLIRELLQVDYSDLDFGLYRLLRLKRDEVEAFITQQLPEEVDKAFATIADSETGTLKQKVDELATYLRTEVNEQILESDGTVNSERAKGLGKKDREKVAEYEALRGRLATAESTVADKTEVFNHLFNFFSRYYEDGDFIPKRRYGARETYAVPWDGSETMFYWANKDQHYVKTAETLKDYTFTLSGDLADKTEWRVRFVLVEASVPKDNVKGDDRFFFPRPDSIECDTEKHECRIGFEYRPPTEQEIISYRGKENARKPDQDKILLDKLSALLKKIPDAQLRRRLSADTRTKQQIQDKKPAEPVPLLLKRLRHFVRRSTTDYFVHKNLKKFLEQELEFYIKDQVLHLGDIEGDIQTRLRMIKVFRRLAGQIIEFLSQIEDAQKRLFEKKKFVTEVSWLIPIQHVPGQFRPDIVKNKAQLKQWKDWLAIEPDEFFGKKGKIDLDFLKGHPTLVVDTRLFPADWTRRLIESLPFDDLDDATDGLLIHSENYQALRLLLERFREQVKCIYIDPPYNTPASVILYKNNYKHSSWITLLGNRLRLGGNLLLHDGTLIIAIDDTEKTFLSEIAKLLFPSFDENVVVVNHHPAGAGLEGANISATHEYAIFLTPTGKKLLYGPRSDGSQGRIGFVRTGTAQSNLRKGRPNSFYAVLVDPSTSKIVGAEPPPQGDNYPKGETSRGYLRIYPVSEDGTERVWRRSYESFFRELALGNLECVCNKTVYIKPNIAERHKPIPSNWTDTRYNAGAHGTNLLTSIIGAPLFSYPKSLYTVLDCISAATICHKDPLIVDYFAGSGTTGHAVINLNREDGGQRKFILVEMGEYFDTVLVPRIVKVMYSPEWKDGKPKRLATKKEAERTPRLVKILRLESYEDALHNIATNGTQERVEKREQAYKNAVGESEYSIRYLVKLPLEATDTMVNLAKFEHPFSYTLEILTEDGPKQQQADLVETFNYLYGLRVKRYETWQHDGREYRVVKATDREGKRRVLVLWRDMDGLKPKEERDFLEAKLAELSAAGESYDEKFINGDCAVPGITSLDALFKRLMTAGEEESA
ncbi:MAG: DNA methyltransferase [candidate division WOR-3 bacterium]